MGAKKSISNSFTVNTVQDGQSTPYYFQEWFAWSNDVSTASVETEPTISGTWSTSIPQQGSYAYLWRKSIRYVWNENTRAYNGETAQYFRMSGTNGTSISVKGNVTYAYDSVSDFPSPQDTSAKAVAKTSNTIYTRTYYSQSYHWTAIGNASDGDAYTVGSGSFGGKSLANHLIMWSSEANEWIDLGQFKGESGVTYYTHIAWATEVTLESSELPIPAGQTNRPNALAANINGFSITPLSGVSYAWMGYLIDTNSSDSQTKQNYTWQRNKGEKGDDASEVNPNMLLRTVFDRGIDFVKEKWSADWSCVDIDPSSDTIVEGRKCIRIDSTSATGGEAISQDVLGKIKPNTWYTVSFNSFQAGTTFIMSFYNLINGSRTLIYDGDVIVDGNPVSGINNSCDVVIHGAWDGARHTVTFKTRSSQYISTTSLLLMFYQPYEDSNPSLSITSICMPKLELGQVATAYMANEDDLRGEKGDQGKVGRFFYFAGTFNSQDNDPTHGFVVNDAQAPYFEHTETVTTKSGTTTIKRYHVFNYDTNGTYTMAQMWTVSQQSWNNAPWEVMTNDFKYLITEAIFGDSAHFGGAIINGDWMISQYGVLYDASNNATNINSDSALVVIDGITYNHNNAYTKFDPSSPNKEKAGVINFVPNYSVDLKRGWSYQNVSEVNGVFRSQQSSDGSSTYIGSASLLFGYRNADIFRISCEGSGTSRNVKMQIGAGESGMTYFDIESRGTFQGNVTSKITLHNVESGTNVPSIVIHKGGIAMTSWDGSVVYKQKTWNELLS